MSAETVNEFFFFLYAGKIGTVVSWLQLISGIVSSALFAGFVVVVIKYRELVVPASPSPEGAEGVAPPNSAAVRWGELQKKIESPSPGDWNFAVVQADAIFDEVLKEMGLPGATMGERLQSLDPAKLESLNDVWEAHKLRNRIVHDSDRVLTQGEAARAFELLARGLTELGYIE